MDRLKHFEIGEVALVYAPHGKMHGQEVVIVGPVEWREGMFSMDTGERRSTGHWYHKVTCPALKAVYPLHKKETAYCPIENLRKRQPPQDLGSWREIAASTGWKPGARCDEKILQTDD